MVAVPFICSSGSQAGFVPALRPLPSGDAGKQVGNHTGFIAPKRVIAGEGAPRLPEGCRRGRCRLLDVIVRLTTLAAATGRPGWPERAGRRYSSGLSKKGRAPKTAGASMIDLYYWTTPNGHKITMFLEEAGLEYRIIPINIGKGDQFQPDFLKIAPNNRIPAIVDQKPADGGAPIPMFESGAILQYLAEKTGQFLSADLRKRWETLQWLFWQMGGLGPMAGQNHHFSGYAPEKIPYAIDRYVNETARLYRVLNTQLEGREFIAGDYSIADMASYPWVVPHERQGQKLEDFPNLKRWFETIAARPATKRAYELAATINTPKPMTDDEKKILFNQR
jgi:GST-like protein